MVNTGCEPPRPIRQDGNVEPAKPDPVAPGQNRPHRGAAEHPPATDGPAEATAPPGDDRLGRRGERSPRDMALSLAVLLVPIVLALLFYRFVLSGDAPVTIDAAPTIQEAQSANVFPIAVPRLGDDWHASSAAWQRTSAGATLRIGYVDPDSDPVQLVESDLAVPALIRAELTAAAAPAGTHQIGARAWQRYTGRPGEDALVLFEKGRTIIIVGKTSTANLDALAAALS
jgi:Protein of unknown function (DUF4245)